MEGNVCDVNHLDSDVLLPPRKRLLACLKKQNGDGNGNGNGNSYSPSTSSSLNEFDTRLNYLLRAHLCNDNPSQKDIVEASRSAAKAAVKVAVAARAAAQEKAVIAANAMAAAKRALELVATVDEPEILSSTERESAKNKTKKRVEVQMLYNNKKPRLEKVKKTNDEEVARKLHRTMNSSPRISKCDLPSKHKRLKGLSVPENGKISTIGEGNSPFSNGAGKTQAYIGKEDENKTKIKKSEKSKAESKDAEKKSKVKFGEEESGSLGRKRGRMKQKKLPLSICHDRDQANPTDGRRSRISTLVEEKTGKATSANDRPSFSVGPSANSVRPVERNSSWKCQAFKAPACIKQNKVMQL